MADGALDSDVCKSIPDQNNLREGDMDKKALQEELEEVRRSLKRAEHQLEKSQNYNEDLRQQIEVLSAELHTYRTAAQHRKEAGCQVAESDIAEAYGDKPFPDWGVSDGAQGQESEKTVSIAESLKAAAEEAQWNEAGYVYDSTSGLYYDCNSGYYYDSERSLFYEPNTGAYYYYDEQEAQHKFHSYAQGYGNQQTSQTWQEGGEQSSDLTQNSNTVWQPAQQQDPTTRAKTAKHKHREKPKVKKDRIPKTRRRTKSSKHSPKARQDEKRGKASKTENEDQTDTKTDAAGDMNSKDNEDKDTQNASVDDEEAMEVESSDGLATGESELESGLESGEITDDSSSTSSSMFSPEQCAGFSSEPVNYDNNCDYIQGSVTDEVSANYPPCIRVVIQASDTVSVGSFFLITCTGGTIGREKDSKHVIQIPDINVSKVHADIQYDHDNCCYTVQDLGSQNGTFVNNLRISESKEKSAAVPLNHDDVLQVAGTQMLLHIHPGTDTCDSCEPGQVMASLKAQNAVQNDHIVLSKEEKRKQARAQLKNIKKKYGLANSAYVDNSAAINNPDYANRADLRRQFIGSEHHSTQNHNEAPASVHRPISSTNKGHRMLAKMGWTEGKGLGKDSAGRAEPVSVELRANQTAGLGSTFSAGVSLDNVVSADKARRLAQTRKRYERLEKTSKPQMQTNIDSANGVATASTDAVSLQTSQAKTNSSEDGKRGEAQNTPTSAKGQAIQMNWVKGPTEKFS